MRRAAILPQRGGRRPAPPPSVPIEGDRFLNGGKLERRTALVCVDEIFVVVRHSLRGWWMEGDGGDGPKLSLSFGFSLLTLSLSPFRLFAGSRCVAVSPGSLVFRLHAGALVSPSLRRLSYRRRTELPVLFLSRAFQPPRRVKSLRFSSAASLLSLAISIAVRHVTLPAIVPSKAFSSAVSSKSLRFSPAIAVVHHCASVCFSPLVPALPIIVPHRLERPKAACVVYGALPTALDHEQLPGGSQVCCMVERGRTSRVWAVDWFSRCRDR